MPRLFLFVMVIYVDVDDTLVRTVGSKRIPIPAIIAHVRELHQAGAELYCWSSGGAVYARESAEQLGIAGCFQAFLPKPEVMIDDQEIMNWRRFTTIHPNNCSGITLDEYKRTLG